MELENLTCAEVTPRENLKTWYSYENIYVSELQGRVSTSMKFLILNYMVRDFTGSEVNALQLCEGLRHLGHDAEIGTFFIGSPLKKQVENREINIINLLESNEEVFDHDVIWAHHSPVLAYLLFRKNLTNARLIYSSLSWLMPLEAPPTFHDSIPLFLSYSPKNTEVMQQNGVPAEKILLFPNFAPSSFFKGAEKKYPSIPKKIAVISNHPPKELLDFSEIARDNAISVDFIGQQHKPMFVDDVTLQPYDLVITIGKTVFYCFALRTPVYCYDHYDGPGYITTENFSLNKDNNFSGKGIDRKLDGRELYDDIIQNYSPNLNNLLYLYKESDQLFNLEKNLKRVIDLIPGLPLLDIQKFRAEHSLDERIYDLILMEQEPNLNLVRQLEIAHEEIAFYSQSKSWKITKPLRQIASSLSSLTNPRNKNRQGEKKRNSR